MQASPDAIETAICGWYEEINAAEGCPAILNDPNWVLVAQILLGFIALYCLWPIISFGIKWLIVSALRVVNFITRMREKIRRLARAAIVNTIEETTGKKIFIDRSQALHIIRLSKFATVARMRGKEPNTYEEFFMEPSIIGRHPKESAFEAEYESWISKVLKKFEAEMSDEHDPDYVANGIKKTDAGEVEYSEKALRRWLNTRWDRQVINKFGDI